MRFYQLTGKTAPDDADVFVISTGSGQAWNDRKVTWAQLKAIIKSLDDLTNYYVKSDTYSQAEITALLGDYVQKVEGYGLSQNDFTDAKDTKLTGISDGATKTEASTTNGNIKIDGVQTQVYDDSAKADKSALWIDATVSGNPVTIKTQSAQNAKQTIITMAPIQSGSGTPAPDNVRPITGRTGAKIWGSGKNLLPTALTEIKSINTTGTWSGNAYTINDVTFTVQTDGDKVVGINANGTASADATLFVYGGTTSSSKDILFPGDVKISIGTANNGSTTTFLGVVWSTIQNKFVYGTEAVSGGYNMTGFGVHIKSGYNAQNVLFKPMIRLSDEDATFVPYVQGDSVTIPFGSTIYGGTLNVETGALTVDTMRVELDTLNWSSTTSSGIFYADDDLSEFIGAGRTIIACDSLESVDNVSGLGGARTNPNCSICGYSGSGTHRFYIRWDAKGTSVSDLVSALDGVYACYKLATPTTTTLTAAQVNLIKGINKISTDADGISIAYFADGESITDADNRITAVLGDLATVEGARASQNYAVGDYLVFEDKFCKASVAIASGEVLKIGTNLTQTTVGAELKAIIEQL